VSLALVGTSAMLSLGRHLPRLYRAERRASNNYRYALTRTRANAESIAFYNGQEHEERALRELYATKQSAVTARKAGRDLVAAVSATYRKLTGLLPLYLLAPRLGAGDGGPGCNDAHAEGQGHGHAHAHGSSHGHSHASTHLPTSGKAGAGVAAVLQTAEAFDEILFHLMIVAENLNDFARLGTAAQQVEELTVQMERLLRDDSQGPRIELNTRSVASISEDHNSEDLDEAGQEPWLVLDNLTVLCRETPLIKSLDFKLMPGMRLLVTGESGVGKTTLLRAIQGLYKHGTGSILRPPQEEVLFIPQQPYMALGSLREQLLYPMDEWERAKHDDSEILSALNVVGLKEVLQRFPLGLDTVAMWSEVLSVGEQQRLSIARFVLQPNCKIVFLDESTSACDLASERRMYALIAMGCASYVSVGHRTSIERFHDQRLTLLRDGSWQLDPLVGGFSPTLGSNIA